MANKASASDRRAAQREALRKQREAELKRQRSRRTLITAVVSIAALVLAAGVGYLLWQAFKPEEQLALNEPTSISRDTPYFEVGAPADSGKPVVDLVQDFMCPFCGEFESVNSGDITQMIDNEEATVRFYTRTFLSKAASTTQYSGRAAGAAVCTFEQGEDVFLKFQQFLWDNQPTEGGPGLTDTQLVDFAKQAGANDDTVSCITEKKFQRWAEEVLEPAGGELSPSTPAVRINGAMWSENQALWREPGALRQAVTSAAPAASDAGQ